jgi:hypothetical protein
LAKIVVLRLGFAGGGFSFIAADRMSQVLPTRLSGVRALRRTGNLRASRARCAIIGLFRANTGGLFEQLVGDCCKC